MIDNAADALLAARDMIADKENHWTRNDVHDAEHERHCALGAIECAVFNHYSTKETDEDCRVANEAEAILNRVSFSFYKKRTHVVNDFIGHEAIMKIYDEAIRQAKDIG